jgi:hypothetical protein
LKSAEKNVRERLLGSILKKLCARRTGEFGDAAKAARYENFSLLEELKS